MFTRITYYTADKVEAHAKERGVPVVWVRARCQHGRTLLQFCGDCSFGEGSNGSTYARTKGSVALSLDGDPWIGATDDKADVCYIPGRFQEKV
jgi:hypothetical protein